MTREANVEIFAEESNFAVIRVPSRQYPGVLIQGDSLTGIVGDLEESIALFNDDREEAFAALKSGLDQLKWRLDAYLEVCKANGVE